MFITSLLHLNVSLFKVIISQSQKFPFLCPEISPSRPPWAGWLTGNIWDKITAYIDKRLKHVLDIWRKRDLYLYMVTPCRRHTFFNALGLQLNKWKTEFIFKDVWTLFYEMFRFLWTSRRPEADLPRSTSCPTAHWLRFTVIPPTPVTSFFRLVNHMSLV